MWDEMPTPNGRGDAAAALLSRPADAGRVGGVEALGTALRTLDVLARLAWIPQRQPDAGAAPVPDIQFDVDRYVPAPVSVEGVLVRFPPVHTVFVTARLARAPSRHDREVLADALASIEQHYPWHPSGVFTHVAYGRPYFDKLPQGPVLLTMPRLLSNTNRFVLEEAVPAPTDVHPDNPGIHKLRFNVPVRIERNDMLFTLRGDNPRYLADVVAWLGGSDTLAGLTVASPRFDAGLSFTSSRTMFIQLGLPRRVAGAHRVPYHYLINLRSPMWMGFADHQVEGTAAQVVTFQGAEGIRLTTARSGDYFDNGSIQHLSHDILDLQQFYDVDDEGNPGGDAAFMERVQEVFRCAQPPSPGRFGQPADRPGSPPVPVPHHVNGGSGAGTGTRAGEHRLGHLSTLRRSSRTADGRPIHLRVAGPGFDAMDTPDGRSHPKLQFSIFVPTSDFFTTMRRSQAAPDTPQRFAVDADETGLERFLTATRRQNFLVPPRRHRAFPLLEVT